MAPRRSIHRLLSILGSLTLAGLVGGCGTSGQVAFTNVSDTWLNVRFYVADSARAPEEGHGYVSEDLVQIAPGDTARVSIRRPSSEEEDAQPDVHLQITAVTPSWEPTGKSYWLQLLQFPPVTIVATGGKGKLQFHTGTGALAMIPAQQIERGRFEHRIAGATDDAPR